MSQRPRVSTEEIVRAPSALYTERRHVRFQDIDAAGIIYFARVQEYFHDAFVGFCRQVGIDLPEVIAKGKWGLPLAHAEADYMLPLRFGDEIVVELVWALPSERSITLVYRARTEDGRVRAVGQMVHVCIDRETFRSMRLPDELRAVLTPDGQGPGEAEG
ncbi:acyl-CoA thioesterase [Polyangium aurulentum]|uniref:acyl-CoA thioesterase n=1 Tax=Polyangium aurulentum TaxID=2567896 RepID=UPI0010AE337A|nr:thioesterase family protein [Polyangium aurulentum]UQA57370.1 acyl-CoA thioesterase [Polyangium aurulentum]